MVLTRISLGRQARWLLVISGIFALSVSLSNTFVNVYLWKVDKSYISIGLYNLCCYVAIPITFVFAGYTAKKFHSVLTLRLGIALHALFYLTVLIGGIAVAAWPPLLGIIIGVAAGFYWCSFNELSLQFTDTDTRDRFYGLNGVMGAIAGMAAPPVAGFLIAREDEILGGLTGYHSIFGLSMGLFLAAALLSIKLHVTPAGGNLSMKSAFRGFRVRPWRMILLGCMVYGLREGVFLFLIGLLIYISTGSELRLGEFVLLQSALSFVSFYVVSRVITPRRRLVSLGIGAVCMALAALLFLLPIQTTYILWYGSIVAVSIPLFLVPLQGYVFGEISRLPDTKERHMEHIIMREVAENFGRVLGIAVFIVLMSISQTPRVIASYAVVLGFVQIVTWWLIYWGQKSPGRGASDGEREHSGIRVRRGVKSQG